ncbi:hypothetical protein BPUTEOMOX_1642 [methanotrophic endosymbiont of Bathymodiolus puteoserpentis (Logatchev)]|nr:hypothetical protein BPUTEOMOX_1642 [methanotrophic endosymbiont of Bathymodiolus puteoserpentis (Logatchev)]
MCHGIGICMSLIFIKALFMPKMMKKNNQVVCLLVAIMLIE